MDNTVLNERAAKLLDEAADLLDKEGWCRNVATDGKGRRCAVSAMNYVARTDFNGFNRAIDVLEDEIIPYFCVPIWNDSQPERRYVTRTLRRAARRLRGATR